MRTRLRPRHADEAAFYRERYPDGYDHTVWPDHLERVDETVRFATETMEGNRIETVADLSCGDGSLPLQLAAVLGVRPATLLGDVNERGTGKALRGALDGPADCRTSFRWEPLPGSLEYLDPVDLYVCSETLEHLDDPDGFLALLQPLTRYLLLTTPEGETTDGNPEHYWGWDSEAVGAMLATAGFSAVAHQVFTPQYQTPDVIPTQMWICS